MKKIFVTVLAVLLFVMAACNNEDVPSNSLTDNTFDQGDTVTTTAETTATETTTTETTTTETTTTETTTAETTTEASYIPRYFEGEYDERKLYLSDFEDVTSETPLWKVYEMVGLPNGAWGSPWIRPYYRLADGSHIVLQMYWDDDDSEVMYLAHFDNDGTYTEINRSYETDVGGRSRYAWTLQLSDFENVSLGMPMWQIYEMVGPPNSFGGVSCMNWPIYQLADGTKIELRMNGYSGYAYLLRYIHISGETYEDRSYVYSDWFNEEISYVPRYFEGKYNDRDLALSDFEDITQGTPLWKVYEMVGLPNGATSGWVRPYYILSDGTRMVLFLDWYDDNSEVGYLYYFANDDIGTAINRIYDLPIFFGGNYDERELTVHDFEMIPPGARMWQVYEYVGNITGHRGVGWSRPYYKLSDGSEIVVWTHSLGDNARVWYFVHFANDGTRTDINKEEDSAAKN